MEKSAVKKTPSKKPSFGDAKVKKISAVLPEDLLRDFNILIAQRTSRLNTELAEAMRLYLKQYKQRKAA